MYFLGLGNATRGQARARGDEIQKLRTLVIVHIDQFSNQSFVGRMGRVETYLQKQQQFIEKRRLKNI